MVILASLAAFLGLPAPSSSRPPATPREVVPLDAGWRFLPGDDPGAAAPSFDDSRWTSVDVPHDWSIGMPRRADAPCGRDCGYSGNGTGWYRRTMDIPSGWSGRRVWVEFDGVYMNARVWIDGHDLGERPFGYSSFRHDLTPYIRFGGRNVLAVRVDNSAQPNSRWYSGSGIFRHVRLVAARSVHIAPWGVSVATPRVSAESADVVVRTAVRNEAGLPLRVVVRTSLRDPAGKPSGHSETALDLPAGGSGDLAAVFTVPSPRLWSTDDPARYTAVAEARIDRMTVDALETPFGIRSISFDPERGFALNGIPMKMKGTCVHHDNGPLGAAAFDRAEERKVELLKASGFNAIRTSHNPPSPGLLDACDRLGVLVIDEAFDCWRKGKRPHDYHEAFDEWWKRDLEAMVLRDRNHPSVIMWSIGNELEERAEPEGARIARELADFTRSLDPTRPVTAAINGVDPWTGTDGVFAALDVGGYNYQRWNYRPDHARFPGRVMVATESNPPESFEYWMDTVDLPYVIGDFVWTGWDYLGEASIGYARWDGDGRPAPNAYPWNQANCGDIDLCGMKRPQSFYRDVLWGVGSKLWIAVHAPVPEGKKEEVSWWGWPDVRGSWTWPGHEGKPLKVEVYSGCEKVELLLNGRPAGSKPTSRSTRFMANFEVPYEPGTLTAVGYIAGKKAAEWKLATTDAPAAIRLVPDRGRIRADGQDLCYATVEVVDGAGRIQPNADSEVSFRLEGPGRIAGVGNGCPFSEESYAGATHRVWQGRALVIVRSTEKRGRIRLSADSPGLSTGAAVIRAE